MEGGGGRRMRLWQERNGKGGDAAAAAVDTHEVRFWQERNGKGGRRARLP